MREREREKKEREKRKHVVVRLAFFVVLIVHTHTCLDTLIKRTLFPCAQHIPVSTKTREKRVVDDWWCASLFSRSSRSLSHLPASSV